MRQQQAELALTPAAFPSLQWPDQAKRQKVDDDSRSSPMQKQDSAQPGRLESPFGMKSKHVKVRDYACGGLACHGIPLLLDLKTDAGFDFKKDRKETQNKHRDARYRKFMTTKRRQKERDYRTRLVAETSNPREYSPSQRQNLMMHSNIVDSPRDEFDFLESMETSDEEVMGDSRHDQGQSFEQLHITLKQAVVVEALVENVFPGGSTFFDTRAPLCIPNGDIENIIKEDGQVGG